MPVAEAAPPLAHPVPEAPRAPLTEKAGPQTANKKGKLPRGFRKWGRGLLQRVKQVAPLYRAVKKGEMRKTEAMFHLIANEGAGQPTGDSFTSQPLSQAELQAAEIPKQQELAQDIAKASGKARGEMQQVNEATAARDAQEAQVRALQDQILHIQGEGLSPETRDKLIAAINERITNMIASPAVADNEAHNAKAIMTHAQEVRANAQARPPLEPASSSESPQGLPPHPEDTTPEQKLARMKETQELQRKQQEARNAEVQIAAEDTADATIEEINTLFDHFARLPGVAQEHVNLVKDPKLLRQAGRFAGYLFRHRQEVQVYEVVENAALVAKAKEEHQNAVFQLESVKEAQDIMQRHSNLAEALEELKQKRLETSQMQVGDDAEKEASKQRELAKIGNEQRLLSEIKTKAEGELPPQKNETPEQKQQREKAVNMREREMLQGAAEVAGNKIKEAEAKLQVPQAAFAEALKHVPQKTNNQFFKYLCNLPDWLQKYPQMGEQLEALNKKAIGKKRLRPLLIMLIVLTLGSAPIFEEFQRMMKIQ